MAYRDSYSELMDLLIIVGTSSAIRKILLWVINAMI